MFKRIQVSTLAIRLGLVLTAHLSLGLDASDPCSDRKFCGNLTIIYNGAGENLANGDNKGVDPAARDTVKYLNALASASAKNSKVLLMSSDTSTEVAGAVATAQKKMGANFTHIPTSRPSFDQYLNNDAALAAMKKSFESDPDCQEFIKNNPGVDLSKFIKVDVVVASHSGMSGGKFAGLPVWPSDNDRGEDTSHDELLASDTSAQNSKTLLKAQDFDQLRTTFGESVFQNISVTCDGKDVAELILPKKDDSCACYVGYTDSGMLSIRSSNSPASVMDDSIVQSKGDGWPGSKSLATFANPMQNYNRWMIFNSSMIDENSSGKAPSFAVVQSRTNHLDSYAISSADTLSSSVLKSTPATLPSGVNIKLVSTTSDRSFNVAYREIESLIAKAKEQQLAYTAGMKRNPEDLKKYREEARGFFNNCIFKPDPKDTMCINFKELVGTFAAQQATDPDFLDATVQLNKVKSDFKSLEGSPILVGKNSDPVGHLASFREQWQNFVDFRNSFTRAARKLGRADESVAALDQMSVKWAAYHSTYVHAYFPDLVKDTLDRRTDNYAKAAQLLKDKFIETGDPKYKKMLEKLRSQLACVLNFPLGPNYREVHEFPVGRLIVDATNPDKQEHAFPGSNLQPSANGDEKPPRVNSNETPALR